MGPGREHLRSTYVERAPSILLGDSGYPLEPWLFTPFDINTRVPAEVKFNKLHKAARNVVERTFGATKARFRCVLKHRTLHYDPTVAGTIINAVCTLHNLCIAHKDELLEEEIDEESDDEDDPFETGDYQS